MNPRLGIFLARDPWGGDVLQPGSMNGWNYGDDNPVNRVDPSGRFSAVRLAHSAGFSSDWSGVEQWFNSVSDYWGWALLLLDAESGDNFYNFSGLRIKDVRPGVFDCKGGMVRPLDRPSVDGSIWWRRQGAYGLRKKSEGYQYLWPYVDKEDSGNINDFPDFFIAGGSGGQASVGFIIDRYGTGSFSLTGPMAAYGFYGEGYISRGNIFMGYNVLATEEDLRGAIEGVSISLGGALMVDTQLQINFCIDDVLGLMGRCYTGVIYTSGVGGQLGMSVGGTLPLPSAMNNRFESWNWTFQTPGPTRNKVWERVVASYAADPCGECSAAFQ